MLLVLLEVVADGSPVVVLLVAIELVVAVTVGLFVERIVDLEVGPGAVTLEPGGLGIGCAVVVVRTAEDVAVEIPPGTVTVESLVCVVVRTPEPDGFPGSGHLGFGLPWSSTGSPGSAGSAAGPAPRSVATAVGPQAVLNMQVPSTVCAATLVASWA